MCGEVLEDLAGALLPHGWTRVLVPRIDPFVDRQFEFFGGPVRAAPNHLLLNSTSHRSTMFIHEL